MNNSILITKPLKKIPNILIYYHKFTTNFSMCDLKKNRYVGEMIAYPSRNIKDQFLYIKNINISPEFRKQGYGTKFLDFAQTLSKKLGLNGRLATTADPLLTDHGNPPHLFLRKYGFGTEDSATNRKFDKLISKDVQLKKKESYACNMFYPAKPLEPTFLEQCISSVKKFFRK